MMADVTGGTPPTGASPFRVPEDIAAAYQHFGDESMFSVATTAGLPASGNWPGRMLMTRDTGAVWVYRSSWQMLMMPWTTYTPTVSGCVATADAAYKIEGEVVTVRYRLSVTSMASNPGISLPVNALSGVEHLAGASALIPASGSEAPAVVRKSAPGAVVFYSTFVSGGNVYINNISAGVPINFAGAEIAGTFSYRRA